MRDLRARLKDIVRRERHGPPAQGEESALSRTLTYEPDLDVPETGAAGGLGGLALDARGACVVIEHLYAAERSHGRKRIDACAPGAGSPLRMLDARVAGVPEWWRRVVFFDIETTGLSGGAGTVAFLVGCGWFEEAGFRIRQWFLSAPSGERPMLEDLGRVFRDASLLVTFNGRTFDVPFMETRWAFHRTAAPTEGVPHLDMLPVARRLWRRREIADDAGCTLSALERDVLGFHRGSDVPGFEIPARYFQFLRTGHPALINGVLEHNRHDVLSLGVITGHALWLVQEGPEACRDSYEHLALGRLYEQAGEGSLARAAFEMAASLGHDRIRREAFARMAEERRRAGDHAAAASAWQQVLDLSGRGSDDSAIARRAAEALAIYHEHRAKDIGTAQRYARALEAIAGGRARGDVDRRLRRLERKLSRVDERSFLPS